MGLELARSSTALSVVQLLKCMKTCENVSNGPLDVWILRTSLNERFSSFYFGRHRVVLLMKFILSNAVCFGCLCWHADIFPQLLLCVKTASLIRRSTKLYKILLHLLERRFLCLASLGLLLEFRDLVRDRAHVCPKFLAVEFVQS